MGFACLLVFLLAAPQAALADPPAIQSFDRNRAVHWTSDFTNGIAVVEATSNLIGGAWSPYFYDIVTNTLRVTQLPNTAVPKEFYRMAIRTNIMDPSLVMHLSFDNDFSNGIVLDVSGHDNHGRRYGYPANPETNRWPSKTTGPDGSQAARFRWYADGWGDYGKSGDYIGIPTINDFTNMSQVTISYWCHYYATIDNQYDGNSTPLQSGQGKGTWTIGRFYDDHTTFNVATTDTTGREVLSFPDKAPTGDAGGWHHYALTFDNGSVVGYFDGTNFSPNGSGPAGISSLTVIGEFLGIACWTFSVSPWLDSDGHPNNAWINGALDDIRIYRRVLSSSEIFNLYTNFDKVLPTVPQDVRARAASSSQVEVHWTESTDNARVDGYRVRRNGTLVGEVKGRFFVDSGAAPQQMYSYTIQAFDPAGNASALSAVATVTTPAVGSPVEVILDDADGVPWVTTSGFWETDTSNAPNFWDRSFLKGTQAKGAQSLIFRPRLPEAGSYQVYVWNPGSAQYPMWVFSGAIPVDIVHAGTTSTVMLNEQVNYARWNLLGTYDFAAGTNGFVRVRVDGTGSDLVTADGVRFVK